MSLVAPYRRHYLRFLQHVHGWSGAAIPTEWHVDHVFNRARARKLQLKWVRMMLLDAPINTSHGAGYEKGRTNNKVTGALRRNRSLDEVTLMKVAGLRNPPKHGVVSAELKSHAQWIAKKHNLSAQDVILNVTDLLSI